MNWIDTRRKLLKLATGEDREGMARAAITAPGGTARASPANGMAVLGDRIVDPPSLDSPPREGARAAVLRRLRRLRRPAEGTGMVRAASLCVASGKGGTGKSIVSASLSSLFSGRGRTLLVDLDLGVGNAHILQDVSPARSLVDVVEGRHSVAGVVAPCSGQVDLVPAGSGVPRMADLSGPEMHLLAAGLADLDRDYRYLVVDSAAGVSLQTVEFARACDVVLIVTTPDLTAMTDAYAFLKVLVGRSPRIEPLLLVNRAGSEREAQEVAERILRVCRRFLGRVPRPVGWIPDDKAVTRSVNQRGPVVLKAPEAPASAALRRIAVTVLEEMNRHHARGMGRALLRHLGHEAPLS